MAGNQGYTPLFAKSNVKPMSIGEQRGAFQRARNQRNGISTTMDPKLFPPAVPGGYTITPKHALGADGQADTTWLHPDLSGPKGNRVNQDYDKKQPGVQGSGDPQTYMPVTQSSNTPIITRSHNEEYVSKKQQWGDNPNVKAAADKGFETGQAWRAGGALTERPDYITPGSDAYMARADMKVWAEANPEAAADLRSKYLAKEGRNMERAGYTTGNPENKVGFKEDPTQTWKDLTGSETILDGQTRTSDLVKGVQAGIEKTKGERAGLGTDNDRQTLPALNGEKANVVGEMNDVQEAQITNLVDQNPGMSRGRAAAMVDSNVRPPADDEVVARIGATGEQVPNEAIDRAMEREGMQRNQAIDMPRSEEPMAHMEMGKRFTDPNANRATSFFPLQMPALSQATFTGTSGPNGVMQPPSGLNDVAPVKSPLKYEQGNVHNRVNEDLQRTDDTISANKFAWEINNNIGKRLFGEDYSPARERPVN